MPITPQDVEKVVLEEDDFGHEMRVGNILDPQNIKSPQEVYRCAHFTNPIHGATYTDPKTNKARQFDFRSQVYRVPTGKARISLAVEPEYFDCLSRHGVTHVFNSWNAMPPVDEQMALPGSRTNPSLIAARFLLKPGRSYEEAVKTFQPYDRVKEPNPSARSAGKALIAEGKLAGPNRTTLIYVNNRLEGNALETIQAMVEAD